MTTGKTVANRVQWVHMCPTGCKWHQTTYKWKLLTSNPKTVKWTSHELTSQEMKIPKLFQLTKTYKHANSFCSILARLLQNSWTVSGNKTENPGNCFLDSFCYCCWTASATPCPCNAKRSQFKCKQVQWQIVQSSSSSLQPLASLCIANCLNSQIQASTETSCYWQTGLNLETQCLFYTPRGIEPRDKTSILPYCHSLQLQSSIVLPTSCFKLGHVAILHGHSRTISYDYLVYRRNDCGSRRCMRLACGGGRPIGGSGNPDADPVDP